MTPRRILTTAAAAVLLLSLACSLPGLSLPFGRSSQPRHACLPPPTLPRAIRPGEELAPSGPLTLYFDHDIAGRGCTQLRSAVDTVPWVDDQALELRPRASRGMAYR
jgi:hypothetical protein